MKKYINYEERKNTRKAAIYILSSLGAIAILIFIGIPLLGRLAAFVSSLKGNNSKINSSDSTPPPPPKFKYFPESTNQQSMVLNGNTESGATVKLVFNGESQEILADSNGQFSFNVSLQSNDNVFAATATDQAGNQSQKTDDFTIVYDNKSPDLGITTPSDNSSFFGSNQRQVTIEGKTEENAQVTINDRIISVDDMGVFQYTTTLNDGGNTFNVKSKDAAGNVTEKNITLNFTP